MCQITFGAYEHVLIVVCKSIQIVSDYILACMCSSIGQDTSLMICDHIDRHSVVDSCLLFSFVNLLLMWLSVYLLPSAAVVTESVMKWWSVQVIVFSLPSVVDCCLFYFVACCCMHIVVPTPQITSGRRNLYSYPLSILLFMTRSHLRV